MKNKKFEFASNDKVDKYDDIATEFIKKIFGIKEFMISDESLLSDFMTIGYDEKEKNRIYKKILKIYKIDINEIEKPIYLWKIFEIVNNASIV